MPEAVSLEQFKTYIGKEIGLSEWIEITQERINAFAECTEDRQWIHTDPELAKKGPYGKTVAHGYLVLSLLPFFNYQNRVFPAGAKMALNYGLNRLRFMNPVPVGSKLRNHCVLKDVADKGPGKILVTFENTIEIDGQKKPAAVAESLAMVFI